MKRVLLLTLGLTLGVCAQEAPKDKEADEAAAAERRARMQEMRAEMLRKNGPVVTSLPKGPGILFRDMQSAVPHEVMTNVVENLGKVTRLPFTAETADPPAGADPLAWARESLASEKTGAVVLLVDHKGWPSLFTAPEESWAIVNVDALREGADDEKLSRRVQQELWRAACFALSASDQRAPKCVMGVVLKPADLDELNVAPFPEYLGRMMQHARALGIENLKMAPYRKAVEDGWAEKPANENEQRIWDEVKKEQEEAKN
ncbi:MAG: hypothetical protein FWF96_06705 [Kiritimatiellaeota bacterium]|nr:hypothetical protein [Kiritimatiellota bacterium]